MVYTADVFKNGDRWQSFRLIEGIGVIIHSINETETQKMNSAIKRHKKCLQ